MILKLKSPIIPLQSLMKICCCRHPTSVPLNLKSIENWDRNEAISLLDDRRRAVKVVCLNQFCHWIDPSAHPIIACRPPPSKRNNRWPNARRIIHFGSNFVRSFYHIAISLLFIICLFFFHVFNLCDNAQQSVSVCCEWCDATINMGLDLLLRGMASRIQCAAEGMVFCAL